MASDKSLIAITMGDPGGIGGEISIKAWEMRRELSPVFFLLDCPKRIERLTEKISMNCPIEVISEPGQAIQVFANSLPILPLSYQIDTIPGTSNVSDAEAVIESINLAVKLARSHKVDGIVTNPIQKETLYQAGFSYPGHTEYLAKIAGTGRSVMMISSQDLRVVPVTTHLPLGEAIESLKIEDIVHSARITQQALGDLFGISRPRLAVSGVNPHAGEGGFLGLQERQIIEPAVKILQAEGIDIFGPLSADSMFHEKARNQYDAAICMYHDQALIPIKTLAFETSVNVTLGISIIRTSPDHGTAMDIAGKGQARADSLIAAIELAGKMASKKQKKFLNEQVR